MSNFFAEINQSSIYNLIAAKAPFFNPQNEYNCFVIPAFQRKYMWEKSQWQKFWNDAEEHMTNNESWFLGSIITLETKKERNISYYDIIDGQQRLTTIFIYRIALFHVISQLSQDGVMQSQEINYWKDYLSNVSSVDRLIHANDFIEVAPQQTRLIQLYEKYVAKNENTNMRKNTKYHNAFEFFRKKVLNIIDGHDADTQSKLLVDLIRIVNNAQVIWAQVDNLPNAMTMFEVLNNRGKPLNSTDIIKTSYLKQLVTVSVKGISQEDRIAMYSKNIQEAGDYWSQMGKLLTIDNDEEVSLKRFLRHFYIVYNPTLRDNEQLAYKNITEKQVMSEYDSFFSKFNDQDGFNNLKTSLMQYAIYYGILRDPLRDTDKITVPDSMVYLKKFIENRKNDKKENYIAHMLSDINKLGLVQINLLNLYIFSVFMDKISNDSDYTNRIELLHGLISNVFRFVIRRNLTDLPRPNQTESMLPDIMNQAEGKNRGMIQRLFTNSQVDKLKVANKIINDYIALSSAEIANSVKELRYSSSSNLDVRFVLHLIEKWDVRQSGDGHVYVLRDFSNPFDGFKRSTNTLVYQIEHIMPKSLLNNNSDDDDDMSNSSVTNESNILRWKQDLISWGSTFYEYGTDYQDVIVNSMGNLTLLSHNPEASNLPFVAKQDLKNSLNIPIGYRAGAPSVLNNIPVASHDSSLTLQTVQRWTETEISERTRQMHIQLGVLLGDLDIE